MSDNNPKISRRLKLSIYISIATLFLTGITWLILNSFFEVLTSFGTTGKHPAQKWLLIIHGVASYPFLLIFGAILISHVIAGWKLGRFRVSGITLISTNAILCLTGLGLYYLSSDFARTLSSVLHIGFGLALPLVLILHASEKWRARRSKRNGGSGLPDRH